MKIKTVIVIICSLLGFNAFAQESLSLKQAQDFGLANHENIKNAQVDMLIAEQKVKETTAIGLPQIAGTIDFQHFLKIPTSIIPNFARMSPSEPENLELEFGTKYNLSSGIQLSQLIFNGNYLVGLQAAKAYTNVSKVMMEKTQIDVRNDITEAYHLVVILKESIPTLQDSYNKLEELHKTTKILVEERMAEATQSAQLELSLLQIQDGINKINSQVKVAKNLLKMQMGMDLSTDVTLTDSFDDFFTIESLDGTSFNTGQHVNHRLLETQLTLDQLNHKNKKADYLPSVNGYISYKTGAQANAFGDIGDGDYWFPTSLWGLSVNVPIFSSGMRKYKIAQAEMAIMKTENQIQSLDRALSFQMKQAITNYDDAVIAYNTQLKAVEVSKLIIDNTIIKYELGAVMSLEVTQMENQYIAAVTDLTNAKFEIIKMKQAIEKLQGK